MYISDFSSKLNKLNSSLRVDSARIAYPYHQEYPTCGLYYEETFIMGVPQKWVPEWTVAGADLERLHRIGELADLKFILDKGFLPEGKKIEERLLWRGYRAILASLCRQKFFLKEKAEKLFRCEIYPNCLEFPRNYIQLEIK